LHLFKSDALPLNKPARSQGAYGRMIMKWQQKGASPRRSTFSAVTQNKGKRIVCCCQ